MKVNQPVTQVERPFPKGRYLVSRTDLKGIITYANDAFIEISGFSGEELLGRNHNIVRHPDMPPQAFQNLWDTIKAGRPWRGVVKNRSKNGDFYWVDAFVVPEQEGDKTVGYMSVRSEPSRTAIGNAEALYRELNRTGRSLDASVPWFQRIGIGARMAALMALVALLVLATPYIGIAAASVGLLVIGVASYLLTRSIIEPMRRAIVHFDRIAQNILTDEIDLSRHDEAGKLMSKLAVMQVHLKVILDEVRLMSLAIGGDSQRLTEEMRKVVEHSSEQHDRVQSVAAAAEEFNRTVAEVADSAGRAADSAADSRSLVNSSAEGITRSMEATEHVVGAVQDSSASIDSLDRAIQKIGDITKSIREIADQTNLLALNAAIEAARAGEQGRGFAVVADEVRKLAERTSSSTNDITRTVEEFRRITEQAIASMGAAARQVEEGVGRMRDSVRGLDRITASSNNVADMAVHIATAAKQQASASADVASNMDTVATLIDQNTAIAHEAWQTLGHLAGNANSLMGLVKKFQLTKPH
ncbi:MAG: PAS domain-containing protein [Gammaproteobacteria bacterium]|nr:PAS domain-containing protein [Gammaproteobacteria bacterium]MBU1414099.1 PAS domain-containing protein [Gammaproteobacteria bacterium]